MAAGRPRRAALIGAGCSSEPDRTAARQRQHRRPRTGGAVLTCMRENGVREFPDPDASGRLTIDGVLNGSAWTRTARRGRRPSARARTCSRRGSPAARRTADAQEAALEFAQCVRDHGVKDFPDPVEGEPLVNTTDPRPQREGRHDILNAAMQTCGKSSRASWG